MPSPHTRILACILLSLGLLASQQHQRLAGLRDALAVTLYPIQYAVSAPIRWFQDLRVELQAYRNVSADAERLRQENQLLRASLLKYAALQQENRRLRQLLDATSQLTERVLIAELLSVTLAPYEHLVLINQGTRAGVFQGQPVIDGHGIMGQVILASPLNATVMLISDPNHAIPVQVVRNGLRTLALGSGRTDELVLPNLTTNADIREGDLLVSSGLGGVFPHGYPVGTVSRITTAAGDAFARVTARPAAALDTAREVLLVWTDAEEHPPDVPPELRQP